jgi:hypothetical protein
VNSHGSKVLLTFVGEAFLFGLWMTFRPAAREPAHAGKPLSYWVREMQNPSNETDARKAVARSSRKTDKVSDGSQPPMTFDLVCELNRWPRLDVMMG